MKHLLSLALAALAACSSASNYEPDAAIDWPSEPVRLDRVETYHEPGPIDLSGELDLGHLIEIAADRNPRLAAARQRWLASTERSAQARALPDPLLRYTEMIEPIETRVGPIERRFDLTQPIPWPGKLSAAGKVATERSKISELEYHIVLRDTIANVKVSYAEYLFLRKATRIVQQNRKLAQQLAEKASALYATSMKGERDVVTLFDSIKAQSQLSQLAYDFITLEELRLVEATNINSFLSRAPRAPLGEPRSQPFRLLNASVEQLYGLGLQYRQELQSAVHAISAAHEAERLAKLSRVPDFSVGVTYNMVGQAVTPSTESGNDAWGVSLGMTLPIWITKNRARISEARSLRMAAERDRQARIDDLMARITKVYFRLQNAERLVHLYKDSLIPQAEEAMEIAEQWRDVGRDTIGRYLEAQSVWLNFQLAYHRALADYEQMVARMEQLVGTSLGHLRGERSSDETK